MAGSNVIASLIVRVLTDTAELVTGVKKATEQLDGFESRVANLGKAIGGYLSVQAIANFATGILEEIDKIESGSRRLNASAEEFQRFNFAIAQSGGDAEQAMKAIISLTEKLGAGDSGLNSVLRRLNINLDEFKAKDPVARFVQLGTAISTGIPAAEQLAVRLQALGPKGEAALASVDAAFADLGRDAPIYSQQTVTALDRLGDGFDKLWLNIKTHAAESIMMLADVGAEANKINLDRQRRATVAKSEGFLSEADSYPNLPDPLRPPLPAAPKPAAGSLPASIGFAGPSPDDEKALAVALADLSLAYSKVQAAQAEELETRKSSVFVYQLLNGEIRNLTDAMEPFLAKFETSTKVEEFTKRIIDSAIRVAELRAQTDALAQSISGANPTSENPIDKLNAEAAAKVAKLREDSRNWVQSGPEQGNLTAQALEEEAAILDNINIRIEALKAGIADTTTEAGKHLGVIQQVGDAYDKLRAPAMSDLELQRKRGDVETAAAAGRYFGPTDDHGRPDFEKIGLGGSTTNNVTNNFHLSPIDDPQTQDKIARVVDDAVTRRTSERARI